MTSRATVGRLRTKQEFRRALDGRRAHNRLLAARAFQRETGDRPDLGLSVVLSRRMAKAVARNRLRRRIREACRLTEGMQGCWDVVVLPRSTCLEAKYEEIRGAVGDILKRLGICPG
jgi:ribonuclease P protein component